MPIAEGLKNAAGRMFRKVVVKLQILTLKLHHRFPELGILDIEQSHVMPLIAEFNNETPDLRCERANCPDEKSDEHILHEIPPLETLHIKFTSGDQSVTIWVSFPKGNKVSKFFSENQSITAERVPDPAKQP